MIITDGVHLVSTRSEKELHGFAKRLGLQRGWFQDHRHPHYDITSARLLQRALQCGAIKVNSKTLVANVSGKVQFKEGSRVLCVDCEDEEIPPQHGCVLGVERGTALVEIDEKDRAVDDWDGLVEVSIKDLLLLM